jgi:hypothetical protein
VSNSDDSVTKHNRWHVKISTNAAAISFLYPRTRKFLANCLNSSTKHNNYTTLLPFTFLLVSWILGAEQ